MSIYYDLSNIQGYDKLVNIIVGARGIGKTYGLKKRALTRYKDNAEQFIYMKRTKDDILETISKFYDDIEDEFEGYTFKFEKGNIYFYKTDLEDYDDFDKEDYIAGFYRALSQVAGKKSIPYPKVTTIIYDEFTHEPGTWKLANEPFHLMEFYNTVARQRENVRMYLLSNAISITNEYFRYFKLEINEGDTYGFYVNGEVVLHISESKAFTESAQSKRTYALYKQTGYSDYAVDNKFFYDNSNFVGKRPDDLIYRFTIVFNNLYFGVWQRSINEMLYIDSDKYDKMFKPQIAISATDHDNGTVFTKRVNENPHLRKLSDYYDAGLVGFNKIDTKNIIEMIMDKR